MITDRELQRNFEGMIFNINGVERGCYYATLEDGGAWLWLHVLPDDDCKRINFVISSSDSLQKLLKQVVNEEVISEKEYGVLSYQNK